MSLAGQRPTPAVETPKETPKKVPAPKKTPQKSPKEPPSVQKPKETNPLLTPKEKRLAKEEVSLSLSLSLSEEVRPDLTLSFGQLLVTVLSGPFGAHLGPSLDAFGDCSGIFW